MPIRKELRKFYGKQWREVIRPRILARAGGRFDAEGKYIGGAHCEHCGVLDRTQVWRLGGSWWDRKAANWYSPDGSRPWLWRNPRLVLRVVLTVAHLNHVSGDDRDDNLKLFCGWCHFDYDQRHHHETRAGRKDQSRPLLVDQAA